MAQESSLKTSYVPNEVRASVVAALLAIRRAQALPTWRVQAAAADLGVSVRTAWRWLEQAEGDGRMVRKVRVQFVVEQEDLVELAYHRGNVEAVYRARVAAGRDVPGLGALRRALPGRCPRAGARGSWPVNGPDGSTTPTCRARRAGLATTAGKPITPSGAHGVGARGHFLHRGGSAKTGEPSSVQRHQRHGQQQGHDAVGEGDEASGAIAPQGAGEVVVDQHDPRGPTSTWGTRCAATVLSCSTVHPADSSGARLRATRFSWCTWRCQRRTTGPPAGRESAPGAERRRGGPARGECAPAPTPPAEVSAAVRRYRSRPTPCSRGRRSPVPACPVLRSWRPPRRVGSNAGRTPRQFPGTSSEQRRLPGCL